MAGVPHLQEEEVLQVLQQYQEQEQEKYQHQEPENQYQHQDQQEEQKQYRDPAHDAMETFVSTLDPDLDLSAALKFLITNQLVSGLCLSV